MPSSAESAGLGLRLPARVAGLRISWAPSSASSAVCGSADPGPRRRCPARDSAHWRATLPSTSPRESLPQEESVRTLVETKVLTGERDAYRLAKASQTLQIPATAQAILAAPIDRLAPEDTLHLLGEVTSHQSRLDVAMAEAHDGAARGLAAELGMRPLIARCHLGLGKLYARTAECARAEEHLTKATVMYREMDMGFWLEQAEGALGPRHGKPS